MRRKRHQQGSLKKVRGRWIAQWWEEGHRRNKTLEDVRTKSQAQDELAAILSPINAKNPEPSENCTFGDFVNHVYLPFYRRKWKSSTAACNLDRLQHHVISEFETNTLRSFTRDQLQDFLDRKAAEGLSFSTVDHLRWDLRQIFGIAVADDYLRKNPALQLFTPKEAKRATQRVMTGEDVKTLFSVLEVREHLVCRLATVAGMRPGEIFGLRWRHVKTDEVEVEQRLYRGQIDSPKNGATRGVALSEEIKTLFAQWKALCGDPGLDAWVFSSETLKTPMAKDNLWLRSIAPRLAKVGLGWVNFQVMRRTHSTMQHNRQVDPKITADQLGHSVDVDLNAYTKTPLGARKEAIDAFESALRVM